MRQVQFIITWDRWVEGAKASQKVIPDYIYVCQCTENIIISSDEFETKNGMSHGSELRPLLFISPAVLNMRYTYPLEYAGL